VLIQVKDNGTALSKNQAAKVFDQFYRVQKGNTHDVKGFGIGLYYTKKIVEKHDGNIAVILNPKETIFKIELPHEPAH
ncbi:MAG: ATP-binding protein, partial [Flavobacteriaceae bacterium]|nr:ATP-binding protein [Flavobacteriaceae bacterium]